MSDLIERLQKQDGKSSNRALDGEIWCALNGLEFVKWDGAGCVYKKKNSERLQGLTGVNHHAADRISPYTQSMDAAMRLAHNALPGKPMQFDQLEDGRWFAGFKVVSGSESVYGKCSAYAATAPLALLVALFKTLETLKI